MCNSHLRNCETEGSSYLKVKKIQWYCRPFENFLETDLVRSTAETFCKVLYKILWKCSTKQRSI